MKKTLAWIESLHLLWQVSWEKEAYEGLSVDLKLNNVSCIITRFFENLVSSYYGVEPCKKWAFILISRACWGILKIESEVTMISDSGSFEFLINSSMNFPMFEITSELDKKKPCFIWSHSLKTIQNQQNQIFNFTWITN